LRIAEKELSDLAKNALADSGALPTQGLFWFATQVSALNRLYRNTHHD
jgi:hypothetical protein